MSGMLYSYDKGFKLIKSNGDILYSKDGITWSSFKLKTLKYATKYQEFRLNFDEGININKLVVYDLTGSKQNVDVSINNTEIRLNLIENKIYYLSVLIDKIYYNIIILKY